jgi:hypothetical protein
MSHSERIHPYRPERWDDPPRVMPGERRHKSVWTVSGGGFETNRSPSHETRLGELNGGSM